MSAQTDFYLTIDRAGLLAQDAACAARSAGYGPLPRHLVGPLRAATRELERATDRLFELGSTPWDAPKPEGKQMSFDALRLAA
jgi:hypothetical protein